MVTISTILLKNLGSVRSFFLILFFGHRVITNKERIMDLFANSSDTKLKTKNTNEHGSTGKPRWRANQSLHIDENRPKTKPD